MAEERNVENFGLGLIVAAIAFLLFRKEFGRIAAGGGYGAGSAGAGGAGGAGSAGASCGCSGGSTSSVQSTSSNPGTSPGVKLEGKQSTQWYAGSGPESVVSAGWGG